MSTNTQDRPRQGKLILGLTGMQAISTIASSFMSSYFLLYLTDYAGLGILGATIAPLILVIGRIVDAVNDPLQGWIIDSAKPRKMGKYKFFCLLSTIILAISICLLYSIPEGIKTSKVMLFVWILFFYLLYDLGSSWFTAGPLVQTITTDNVLRSKIMMFQRLFAVAIGAAFATFMMIVNGVNARIGNIGQSFSIATVGYVLVAVAVSLTCLMLVKEGSAGRQKEAESVKFKDFLAVFKGNKAFTINFAAQIARGFVYALMTATTVYYTKWAYCANLTTGAFDADKYGMISMLSAVITMMPMMIAAILSPMFAKRLGSSLKLMNLSNLICIVSGVAMFILQIAGILHLSFVLFALTFAAMSFGNGLAFVPTETLWLECMDYNAYINGKTMGGTINALKLFLGKGQAALGTLMVGLILTGIGYTVDSATGDYIGELSRMPALLNWFIVVCALLPAIFAVISYVVHRFYPINAEVRAQMEQAKAGEDGAAVQAAEKE